jgi:hypothetical protein
MSPDDFRAIRPTLAVMQQHVEQLCAENDFIWHPWLKRCTKAHAISRVDSPIRSTISYATALHESGITSGAISAAREPPSGKPGHGAGHGETATGARRTERWRL